MLYKMNFNLTFELHLKFFLSIYFFDKIVNQESSVVSYFSMTLVSIVHFIYLMNKQFHSLMSM